MQTPGDAEIPYALRPSPGIVTGLVIVCPPRGPLQRAGASERRIVCAIGLSSALWAVTACSNSSLQGNLFRQGDVAFRVGPIPENWRPIEQEVEGELASFAFRDERGGVTVGAAGRCHRDGDDVPLRSLTQHLYIGFSDREVHAEEEFLLDGRAALRTEMTASLDGVPKQFVFVVLKKDGCVYDMWRIADRPTDSGDFDGFVRGFQVVD